MHKKSKIFGYQTNIGWYDIKTKIKALLRKLTYSWLFQEILCLIFLSYMRLVYYSSKKKFINEEAALAAAKNNQPLIVCFWHNRLMMIPFIAIRIKKIYSNYNFATLSSRHGDGQFVGKIMEKLGLISILGSSKSGRKSSRGIDFAGFKKIFKVLEEGYSLGITPDGPRGPNQKINGEIVNIARISGAGIFPISCSSSRFKKLKTWDNFNLPLPFSTLCFYFDEMPIYVSRKASKEEVEKIKIKVEERLNLVQEKSFKIVKN
jgi:lysophospholipid acyltransferase (LPLAT)-like uncharacterized protein